MSTMQSSATGQAFTWTVRVYYEDTDTGGVVYYANYLKFFERARTEWLRAAGYEQRRLSEESGLQFVVARIECTYRQPARLDDVIEIDLRVQKAGRAFIVFEQTARRGEEVLATAHCQGRLHRLTALRPGRDACRHGRSLPHPVRHPLMTPVTDLSILSLITKATVVVQLVLLLLAVVSIASWTAIFQKGFAIKRAKRETEEFERQFWGGAELSQLYQQASNPRRRSGALERIFESGMSEFLKLRGRGDAQATLDGARRAMRASYQREMDGLESRLNFLASVGSVSPYIGLFGTVWGIMHAFTGLSNLQQANLASVAPGIAEALVATAIGLFAAIPAVVAYNRFAHDIDRLANRFESFMEEFLNILQRQRT